MNTNIEDDTNITNPHKHSSDLHTFCSHNLFTLLLNVQKLIPHFIIIFLMSFTKFSYTQKLDSRINDYEDEEETVPVARAPAKHPDYRSFFDFGYFSDLAASVANAPHPATQTGNSITVRKQKDQNTVELEKFVIPNFGQNDASNKADEFF